jgi:hypothetical protein
VPLATTPMVAPSPVYRVTLGTHVLWALTPPPLRPTSVRRGAGVTARTSSAVRPGPTIHTTDPSTPRLVYSVLLVSSVTCSRKCGD